MNEATFVIIIKLTKSKCEEPCEGRLSSTVPREGWVKIPPLTRLTNMKQITIKVAWNNSAFEGLVSSETSYGEMKIVTKDFNDIIDMGEAELKIGFDGYTEFGLELPEWYKNKEYEFVYKFQDVTAMLKAYSSYVSLAAISRETGINSALLSHYANGLKVPRNKQQKIIVSGLHRIGALLSKCTIDDERKTQLNIERK